MDDQIIRAARLYLARKARLAHPAGTTEGVRWWPSDAEWQPCCEHIRLPSRAYPWSLMTHCRTVEHIAWLSGVNASALRKAANELTKQEGAL